MQIRYLKNSDKQIIEDMINEDENGRDMLGNTGYYEYEVTDGKYWSPSIVAEEE
jgi:hypothetical protein